ncbi:hypothetical protein ILUMI_04860 [Ignelater luminosus]|uniref:DUF4485 domain-containing protein n=1 Tax=Ignelater luminosus TaxID=2038154 RepID=A0A8K0DDG7_IGNLU|nr:hypothetical protein ILUMI_04860 [Ignelater luminosus]
MAREIENKLDEDFLFYLGFTNSYFKHLNKKDIDICRAWLQKLCGEPCDSVDKKRNRNIYLSNLVLCMQEGKLTKLFQQPPNEIDISNALQVFGHQPTEVEPPEWLHDLSNVEDDEDQTVRDGRTYLATRTLPGGEGAFAYLAVTLSDDEPRWLGGGEGVFGRTMKEKFKEYVPPVSEVEQILLRRKDPVEREKIVSFYNSLLQNINKELEEDMSPEENDVVNGLVEQLINDLKNRGQYGQYETMTFKKRRMELLLILHDRIYARRKKMLHRHEVVDDVQEKPLPPSVFDTSVQEQDKIDLPAAMWEQAINKQPNKKNMDALFEKYPHVLIEKFLELLANEKEAIAMRMQRRHENIVAEMRKELRKEGEKGQAKVDEAERSMRQALPVLSAVKSAYMRQLKQRKKIEERKKAAITDQQRLYEQLRVALFDTQRNVEEEAERGRILTEQINAVNARTDLYRQVNDASIRNTEAENITLMKNIKRLRYAIKQHETTVQQIMASHTQSNKSSNEEFYIY